MDELTINIMKLRELIKELQEVERGLGNLDAEMIVADYRGSSAWTVHFSVQYNEERDILQLVDDDILEALKNVKQ